MKVQAPEAQYTVRGVPREVDRALRRRAAAKKLSLNQFLVGELTKVALGAQKRADYSDLLGKWKHDPKFDEIIESQRQVDWEMWK